MACRLVHAVAHLAEGGCCFVQTLDVNFKTMKVFFWRPRRQLCKILHHHQFGTYDIIMDECKGDQFWKSKLFPASIHIYVDSSIKILLSFVFQVLLNYPMRCSGLAVICTLTPWWASVGKILTLLIATVMRALATLVYTHHQRLEEDHKLIGMKLKIRVELAQHHLRLTGCHGRRRRKLSQWKWRGGGDWKSNGWSFILQHQSAAEHSLKYVTVRRHMYSGIP